MKIQSSTRFSTAIATLGTALLLPLAAHAADPKPVTADRAATPAATATPNATTGVPYSDRAQMDSYKNDKDMLKRELVKGHDRAWYTKALTDNGYLITSVNVDKPKEVEYEIVKGNQTHEVKIEFDKAGGMAKEVDINANLWRAEATKKAMAGATVPAATAYVKGNEAYSDRTYSKAYGNEKDRLEKALGTGHDRAYYVAELKKLGYQVTSTNENDKDYVEYEVVKGTNSYEVQVDFDNGKAKKVDVATNMWKAEGTERALDAKKGK